MPFKLRIDRDDSDEGQILESRNWITNRAWAIKKEIADIDIDGSILVRAINETTITNLICVSVKSKMFRYEPIAEIKVIDETLSNFYLYSNNLNDKVLLNKKYIDKIKVKALYSQKEGAVFVDSTHLYSVKRIIAPTHYEFNDLVCDSLMSLRKGDGFALVIKGMNEVNRKRIESDVERVRLDLLNSKPRMERMLNIK